ncbi:TRAP transporter substrate-binding protein DctP [Succinivibrio dextrinosolvens]|uniref:TRAP transporter substrate-binding protein DctP n=1 Tax=Succinivibrio dextrinosolvens TaxID=83771 RepID=UPI0006920A74|nr:TRAP transporter substrate-binding protein DctP [Succinivibrio dextrinosolvens]
MKIIRSISLVILSALILCPLGAVQAKTVVTIAHTHEESHPDHQGFLAFKEYVEKNAGDRYEVQIYANKTSGSNEEVIDLIKSGTIQFMAISTSNLEPHNKKYAVFSLPYLFSSEEIYEKFITDPSVIEELSENNDEDGFTPLAAFTAGTRSFYAKTPIKSVKDLEGKRFRIQSGRTNKELMYYFGANDITISFGEVYKALKNNIVDGAENNELALVDQKHGEFCKYYTYDRHQMCPDMLVGSSLFLYSLPEEDFDMFRKAAIEAQKVEFGSWKKSVEEAKKKAKEMGVTFIDVDVHEFQEKVKPIYEEMLKNKPQIKSLYEKARAFDKKYAK